MKKQLGRIIGISMIVGGLIACSPAEERPVTEEPINEEQPNEQEIGEEVDVNEQEETDLNTDEKEKEQPKEPLKEETTFANSSAIIAFLQEHMERGMALNSVEDILGEPQLIDDKHSFQWRYDFTSKDYRFDSDLMAVDTEGLMAGNMIGQLFVQYNEEKNVHLYYLFYVEDGNYMEYRVDEFGENISPAND